MQMSLLSALIKGIAAIDSALILNGTGGIFLGPSGIP